MEWIGFVFGSLMQLAFLGLIGWAIVRAFGKGKERGGDGDGDQATALRRLILYVLMLATLALTAVGVDLVLEELTGAGADRVRDEHAPLALGLAFLIVAGPAYVFLLRFSRRRLEADESERRSLGWTGYLNLALLASLVITIISAQTLLEGVTGVDDFELHTVVPVLVSGAVWAMHWFWLKAAHGLPDDDTHLATGSLTGLITLVVGLSGLLYVAGDEIYTAVVERVPSGHESPELRSWVITAALGGIVWSWYWLAGYRRAERSPLWNVFVLLIGALGGLVMAVISAATIGYRLLVWYVGEPFSDLPSVHFEAVPVAAAILVVGAATWQYHQLVLHGDHEIYRTEPLRTYDYLVAAAGLVSVVVGATLALVALFEAITPEPVGETSEIANRLVLAAVLTVIGLPLWLLFWTRIRHHATTDPSGELGSVVRRTALIGLFGVGGATVLVSAIVVLFVGFEDLLDGTFGGETVRAFRVALSLIITVSAIAWYHFRVYRSDRVALAALAPPPPPPPAFVPARTRHVVLVGPRGTTLADELAAATGARLERWYRTDQAGAPHIELTDLVDEIEANDADEMLVVVGPDGATVVPYES